MAFLSAGLAFGTATIFFSVIWLIALLWVLSKKTREAAWNSLYGVFTVGMLSSCILLPMVSRASFHISQPNCRGNVRSILAALEDYEKENGTLPEACVVDSDGQPMHSWRVLLLGQLGHEDLLTRYNMNEPWDGPNNRKLADEMPGVYRCLEHGHRSKTHYKLLTGPQSLFDGFALPRSVNVTDEHSTTPLLVEDWKNPINWMKPDDISIKEAAQQFSNFEEHGSAHQSHGIFMDRYSGSHFGMYDGYVQKLGGNSNRNDWERLFRVRDGSINRSEFQDYGESRYNYGRIFAVACYLLLGVLPLVLILKKPRGLPCRQIGPPKELPEKQPPRASE
jgi:hypothetical protein